MNHVIMQHAEPTLPPPLTVLPDIAPMWSDLDVDFDTAANQVVEAHAADGAHRDLPVLDMRTWGVVPADGRFALAPLGGHHAPKVLRNNGLCNLLSRVTAPVEFIRDRLPAPLQLATVNYLLSQPDRPIQSTLRLRNDEVTALVSDRYCPLDAEELVETVRNALVAHGALEEVRVRSLATGMVDVLRLVFPSEGTAIHVGDVTALGLDISTSSFGRSAVHVRGLLWRLVCTNGLRVPEQQGGFSFRHVGDTRRIRDGIHEAIPTCLAHARGVMDQWRGAVAVLVERVEDLINNMRELSVGERKLVEQELKEDIGVAKLPDSTDAYKLVNALTGAARQAEPARRLELEAHAGRVLRQQVSS